MANDNIQANSEKKVVIELDNVRRDFLVGEETVHALKGVSFKDRAILRNRKIGSSSRTTIFYRRLQV